MNEPTPYLCDNCLKPLDGYESITRGIVLPSPCDICGEKCIGHYVRSKTAARALGHRELMVPLSLFKEFSESILGRWEYLRKSERPHEKVAANELFELAGLLSDLCTRQFNARDDAFWRKMRDKESREELTSGL